MVKISILVPIYGVENFISRCAYSLFEQSYKNIEYVFVDDCSPDKSIQILKEVLLRYPNRQDQVKIVRHSKNRGLAATRNTALECATGKYVLNVDSDDYLEHEAIELLCKKAEETAADVVIFGSHIDYSKKKIKVYEPFLEDKIEYVKMLLQMRISPSIWSCFLKRSLYIESEVRAIEGINQGEDLSVTPRLIYNADKIVKLDRYLYNYVQYNCNSYTNNVTQKSFDDMVQVCDQLSLFFSNINDAHLYAESLMILKLRAKIYLLKYIKNEYLPEVSSLFVDVEREYKYLLLPYEQILLFFSKHKTYKILKLYTYTGLLFRKYSRVLFGD